MNRFFVGCISALFLSLPAAAATAVHDGVISRIYADANGIVYMQLKDIDFNGCSSVKNNHYYTLGDWHNRFEEIFAMALAAAHNQDEVRFDINTEGCDGTQSINSPILRITHNF